MERDSSIIKVQFNKKLYYAINYHRFLVAGFKSSMYDSNKDLLNYYRTKVEEDSVKISAVLISNTNLILDNKTLKDSVATKNKIIQNDKLIILTKDNKILKTKLIILVESAIILFTVLKVLKIL